MKHIGTYQQFNWDWRAATNFLLGGTGSGLIIVSALVQFADGPSSYRLFAGLVLVGLGLTAVWLEIGRPMRAINVFFHGEASWMTREAVVATLAFASGAAALLTGIPGLAWAAAAFALAFLYCQARILKATKGIPAWRVPAIVGLILSTGLAEGAGLAAIFALADGQGLIGAGYIALAAVVLRALAWVHYRGRLQAQRAPAGTLSALKQLNIGFLLLGSAAPVLLILAALSFPAYAAVLLPLAGVLLVLSGWTLKFVIITRAAFVQGYAFGQLRRGMPALD